MKLTRSYPHVCFASQLTLLACVLAIAPVVAAEPIVIASGETVRMDGKIEDPVACDGTLRAGESGVLSLRGGLSLGGEGVVDLGGGELVVRDGESTLAGVLMVKVITIEADEQPATIVQQGGAVMVSASLLVGQSPDDLNTYVLEDGLLSAPTEIIGGKFIQRGGVHTVGELDIWGRYEMTGGLLQINDGRLELWGNCLDFAGSSAWIDVQGYSLIRMR